ncbi:MAG: response regulator transcription factor [Betaproteobacteria bacterium]|jgi:two-component system OmpR family response regulator
MRVLLVEDDPLLADALRIALSQSAHQVDVVGDGELADQALRDASYDLTVLDIGLPKMNGRDVLRRLRQSNANTPVLVLSALERIEDRVDLLNLGADDFLQKPFHLSELDARVKALLRRAHRHAKNELEFGRIKLDIDARRCFVDQSAMDLTAREFAVVELLLLRAGRVVTRSQILDLLYGWEDNQGTNTVEVLIYRLRKKLDFSGWNLKTIRGMGYLLEASRG